MFTAEADYKQSVLYLPRCCVRRPRAARWKRRVSFHHEDAHTQKRAVTITDRKHTENPLTTFNITHVSAALYESSVPLYNTDSLILIFNKLRVHSAQLCALYIFYLHLCIIYMSSMCNVCKYLFLFL